MLINVRNYDVRIVAISLNQILLLIIAQVFKFRQTLIHYQSNHIAEKCYGTRTYCSGIQSLGNGFGCNKRVGFHRKVHWIFFELGWFDTTMELLMDEQLATFVLQQCYHKSQTCWKVESKIEKKKFQSKNFIWLTNYKQKNFKDEIHIVE